MESRPRNSPISIKIMAVKEDLDELDAEINNITQELESNNDIFSEPINNKLNSKTMPIIANSLKTKTAQKQISYRTPEVNKNYKNKLQPKKISQTPDFNANSTLCIEDLMSSDDEVSNSKSIAVTTPRKISFRQNKNLQETKNQTPLKSILRSPNSQSNNSYTSSVNTEISNSPRHCDEETNRLYKQSVKIIEKRTHSRFNNDPWFQSNDFDDENSYVSSINHGNAGFNSQELENKADDFYFPKQSTFSYNTNNKSKYKSISEMDRINETQRKREKMAFQHQKEREKEIEEECTFKPVLSTSIPVISAEEEEKIRNRKQQRIEENMSKSNSKIIRFIDPNSEKIASKAKLKKNSIKQIDRNDQQSPSPKVKQLSKKQIQKSCERLSKPRKILDDSNNETDIIEEEEEQLERNKKRKKKYADPEAIERLFQDSTKPKQFNSPINRNSDFNENENQDNLNNNDIQSQKSFHSFMDSKSREIIEKTVKTRNSNDLFEDSIQVAEDKLKYSQEIHKYNEIRDSSFSFRPKINQTPPHFTVNTTDYSILINDPSYTTSYTPKSKKIYYDAKFSQSNQSSPMRKSYIVSPSPKKKKREQYQASEEEIDKILEEVDAQIGSI